MQQNLYWLRDPTGLVQLVIGNVNKAGNCAPQIEQRVQFDCRFGGAKRRPRKHRQAQIDRRGIERVNRVIELHAETVGRVQRARAGNQSLGKLGVNAPIASFVRIGKRRARNPLTDPPCGIACWPARPSTPRCRADFPDSTAARTPSRENARRTRASELGGPPRSDPRCVEKSSMAKNP
jgi:hypothetical protein